MSIQSNADYWSLKLISDLLMMKWRSLLGNIFFINFKDFLASGDNISFSFDIRLEVRNIEFAESALFEAFIKKTFGKIFVPLNS